MRTLSYNSPGQTNGRGRGGGYSTVLPVQQFQAGAPAAPTGSQYGSGRMVPDISADADPKPAMNLRAWLHDRARPNQRSRSTICGPVASFGTKLGFVTPKLWQHQGAFYGITQGGNGYYNAARGPHPCTGLGSPRGMKLAKIFAAQS